MPDSHKKYAKEKTNKTKQQSLQKKHFINYTKIRFF